MGAPNRSARQRVLFLCTHNSARSQIAEGLLRAVAGDRFDVASAGTVATSLRPEAVAVMHELGIDISTQSSTAIERYRGEHFDWVITVCDDARESCPVFPGARMAHWNFVDPAAFRGGDADRLQLYRSVRDEIATRVRGFAAGDRAGEQP